MAFFLSNLKYENLMVVGVRDGVSNKGKAFATLTVADSDGNSNSLSTSEPETIDVLHTLKQGDIVDLTVVCAGGPQKQYAMIARGADSVRVHGSVGY